MAKTPSTSGTAAKPRANLGPKFVYIILNEGQDSLTFRNAIKEVTTSRNKVMEALSAGTPLPFVRYEVKADKRGPGAATDQAGE